MNTTSRRALAAMVVALATTLVTLAPGTPSGAADQTRRLVIFGDSVTQSLEVITGMDELRAELPGAGDWEIAIDTRVGRNTGAELSTLRSLLAGGADAVVLGLGYNDLLPSSGLERVMAELADVDVVVWPTLSETHPRFDYGPANDRLRAARADHANLVVPDWNAHAAAHPGAINPFDPLGVHLTGYGAGLYGTFLGVAVAGALDGVEPEAPADPRAVCDTPDLPSESTGTAPVTGQWVLDADGVVHPVGDAPFHGDLTTAGIDTPPASIEASPTGDGYWIVDAAGVVHAFGDAVAAGDMTGFALNSPITRAVAHPTSSGYWLMAGDGGVFSFGDARFHGSVPEVLPPGVAFPNQPVISMAPTASGDGYWLVAADGGVFSFGDAVFRGSTGNLTLAAPVVSMAVHPNGDGYWLYASDGGVFTFGDIEFFGSVPGLGLCEPPEAVALRVSPTGEGYWVATVDGTVFGFGDAPELGDVTTDADVIDLAIAS